MKNINPRKALVADAIAAGWAVTIHPQGTIVIVSHHKSTGKVLAGLTIKPDGWAFDPSIDSNAMKSFRGFDAFRQYLNLRK